MTKKGRDKVLLEELINKADKIDELTIRQSQKNKDIYNYTISGNNPDVRKHLKNIINNIQLDDMYKIPALSKWITKETIDNITNTIQNATTYEELKCLESFDEFINVHMREKEDITIGILIEVRDTPYREYLRKLLISKITEIDGCQAWYDSWWNLYISSKKIDERERCKHSCRTQFKIDKINEIFEL